jgi:hypothetical protein
VPNRPRLDAYLDALRQEGVAVAGVVGRDPKHASALWNLRVGFSRCCPPRHPTHFELSFLELHVIL